MVTLFPSFLAAASSSRRYPSRSVMSAKSCWVTCGIVVQDRVSAGPEILLMRLSFSSTVSPNAENSFSPATAGWGVGAAGAGSAGALAPPRPRWSSSSRPRSRHR